MTRPAVRTTKEQKRASEHLELHGIVHFLLTEQRCPVIFEGRLGYVSCPGVSKDAFKKAIEKRVIKNLCHWLDNQEDKKPRAVVSALLRTRKR